MKTPDIEIYVKQADMNILSQWLNKHFSMVELPSHAAQIFAKGKPIQAKVYHENTCSDLVITPNAAGKAFSSVWIKNNISQWDNDESCARSLLEEADLEIRCSASGWQEEEEEQSSQWLLLTRSEQKLINW
tara:strand:- start:17873 stop:18265 length:393 start_codon:yes stop_codon:yes gene_type:complete